MDGGAGFSPVSAVICAKEQLKQSRITKDEIKSVKSEKKARKSRGEEEPKT